MKITVAALQLQLDLEQEADNIAAVSALVEEAAGLGARIVLPPELFSGGYFCREEHDRFWALARHASPASSPRMRISTFLISP